MRTAGWFFKNRGRTQKKKSSVPAKRESVPRHSRTTVRDCVGDGRPIKILTLIDEFTREWLANFGAKTIYITPGSPWGERLLRELHRAAAR